jgi:hypothetical protein
MKLDPPVRERFLASMRGLLKTSCIERGMLSPSGIARQMANNQRMALATA